MKIAILGAHGYIGWPLSMYLVSKGHHVLGIDNGIKQEWCDSLGVKPLKESLSFGCRRRIFNKVTNTDVLSFSNIDIAENRSLLKDVIGKYEPNAIVHLAEQPSAPYSMLSKSTCRTTALNNTIGTLNVLWAIKDTGIHLVKLGTMGEYGTPNIDIEEGYINIEHNGRSDTLPFPKLPGSFYHASKVADSAYIEFACRAWSILATDLNQGVVYGIKTKQTKLHSDLYTNFYYDDVFGTAINRFMAQSLTTKEITVYGTGKQKRGFINLNDSLRCIELACLNPPEKGGRMRVMNQFTELFSLEMLAHMVSSLTGVEVKHVPNPRVESENHYYRPKNEKLLALGLEPTYITRKILSSMLDEISKHKQNIDITKLKSSINWR